MRNRPAALKVQLDPVMPAGMPMAALDSYGAAYDAWQSSYDKEIGNLRLAPETMPIGVPNPYSSIVGEAGLTNTVSASILQGMVADPYLTARGGNVVLGRWVVGILTTISSTATSRSLRPLGTGRVTFSIGVTYPRSSISVTVTISGTGGYTETFVIDATELPAFGFNVPTPWDEYRTIDISWSGGYTGSPTITAYIPENCWPLCDTLPSGWTGVPYGRAECRRGPVVWPAWGRMTHIAQEAGAVSLLYGDTAEGNEVSTGWRSPIGCYTIADCTEAIYLRRSVLSGASPVLPYLGRSFWDGTKFVATSPHLGNHLVRTTGSNSGRFLIMRANKLVFSCINLIAASFSATVTVERGADWEEGGSGTTIFTGSLTVTGASYQSFEFDLTGLGPDPDGAWSGWVLVSYAVTAGSAFGAVTQMTMMNDPTPLPLHIPCTDNTIAPGGYHADGIADVLPAEELVFTTSTVAPADVPAGTESFYFAFTDRDPGYHWAHISGFTGQMYEGWDNSPVTMRSSRKALGGITNALVLVPDGGTFYCRPALESNSTLGNYGEQDAARSTLEVARIAVAPLVLSTGNNYLTASFGNWGLASAPPSSAMSMQHHAQWTAPSDGTYTFTLAYAVSDQDLFIPHAAWLSASDPLCIHTVPDVLEELSMATVNTGSASTCTAPSNTPPTSTQGAQRYLVCLIDTAPTGVWDGQAGRVAKAYDPGITGHDIAWEFVDVPNGTVVQCGSVWYKLVEGVWTSRMGSVLTWTRTMTASEVVYIRIGLLPNRYQRGLAMTYRRQRNGNGFAYTISATKRNLIVAGP